MPLLFEYLIHYIYLPMKRLNKTSNGYKLIAQSCGRSVDIIASKNMAIWKIIFLSFISESTASLLIMKDHPSRDNKKEIFHSQKEI